MDFTEFKDLMARLCAWRIPGCNVSVYHRGSEVFKHSAGYSDLENKIPMNGSELVNIYSCSKVVTVTAALQLYEKGYFLLDDPLYDFFPEFRNVYVDQGTKYFAAEKPITLRHLFTMTSGLSYKTATAAFKKSKDETDGRMDTLTVIRNLAGDNLSFEPGEKWQYGLSHDVLAGVVEVISGKKFRDYVRENIFEPLEMRDSFYHNEAATDRMAQQYRFETGSGGNIVKMQAQGSAADGGVIVNAGKSNTLVFGSEYDSGGAGITCTVGDFSKFAQALALGGIGINGERILSPGTVELLRTNQLSPEQQKYFEWKQHRGYGYGLGVRTLTSLAASGSTGNLKEFGWGGAAGATVIIDADEGLSMFYAHHMLNPQEEYYQPRIRNVLYTCMRR